MINLLFFLEQHWLLAAVFVLLVVGLIWVETQAKVSGMSRLNPQQVVALINRDEAVVFDIRERSLFDKGHIANAQHLPTENITHKDFSKYENLPVIIICNTGINASKLGARLRKRGLANLYFLQGGIQAWLQANLPLVKS